MARQTVIHVAQQAATHNTGTKFYEIFRFYNEFGAFVVNRYGKVTNIASGGSESFDSGAPTEMEKVYEKKRRAKFGESGGYVHPITWQTAAAGALLRSPDHPNYRSSFDITNTEQAKKFESAILAIFSDKSVFQAICNALNLPGSGDGLGLDIPDFEEVPEEVRAADESWGAW